MRDRAIGQPTAHRRPVGPARRIHQHEFAALMREALVGAGRGVALHMLAWRIAEALVSEELADDGQSLQARREAAIAGQLGVALVRSALRYQRECNIEPVRRQYVAGAVRPFE